MEVGLRTVAGATGGMLGRGAELGYENAFAGGRHTSDDFYREMRNAFIQNAVQSFAEGLGSRYKRTRTAGGMADDALNYRLEEAEARKVRHSEGLLPPDQQQQVAVLLAGDVEVLLQGLNLCLQDLARGEVLPANVYLCGGGSLLRELDKRSYRL